MECERLLREGEESSVVLSRLADWAADITASHDKLQPVLTACNASFDFPWVDVAMKEAGIRNPFGIAGFCIKSLAMALPGAGAWRKTVKGSLPAELVPPGDFTHHALEDAAYQQKIHFALAGRLALLQA